MNDQQRAAPPPLVDAALPATLVVDAPALARAPAPPAARRLRRALAYLAAGLGVVLRRPGVLLFLLAVSFLFALPAALPAYSSALEHLAPLPGTWLAGHDLRQSAPAWVFLDWPREDPVAQRAAETLAPLLLLASLFGLLVTAGWMGVAVRGRDGGGLMVFLREGGRFWFAFLRTWLLGLAIFYGLALLVWGAPGEWVMARLLPGGEPDLSASESRARFAVHSREVVYVLLLLAAELWLDLARTCLVVGQRRSAFLGMFRGLGFGLREPLRVGGVVLAGLLFEGLWVAAVVWLGGALGLSLVFAALMLPLGRIALRGARLAGLALLYADARRGPAAPSHTAADPPAEGGEWAPVG